MKLAAWCEEKGLKEQAIAHYTAVTRSIRRARPPGNISATRSRAAAGSSPRRSRRRSKRLMRQKQADKHWKPKLEKLRDGLESKDAAKRAKGRTRAGRGDRPASRADDLGDFCARGRAAANRGRADAGADRRPIGVERAGGAGGVQSRGRSAPASDRDLDPARSARRGRKSDRADSQAISNTRCGTSTARVRRASCSSRASDSIFERFYQNQTRRPRACAGPHLHA